MASWHVALIIVISVAIGTVIGFLLSRLILRLMKKHEGASEFERPLELDKSLSRGKGAFNRVLTTILVLIILGTLGTLGYVITTPKVGDRFTEFYILGEKGKAADYPEELKAGEEGRVLVGIINHEGKEVSYHVKLVINGNGNAEEATVILTHEQKWEGQVRFVLEEAGENQLVEFLLYKDDDPEPYLKPLRLWIDVIGQQEQNL